MLDSNLNSHDSISKHSAEQQQAIRMQLQQDFAWQVYNNYFSERASVKEQAVIEQIYLEPSEDILADSHLVQDQVWERLLKVRNAVNPVEVKRKSYKTCYALAASAALLFGIAFLWSAASHSAKIQTPLAFKKQLWSQETPSNKMARIRLSDGTQVMLNTSSKLILDLEVFNDKCREIWLEGEAFFEVASNSEKPFIIHTSTVQTQVWGTSLNVKAYPNLPNQVISVRSGKVAVFAESVQKSEQLLANEEWVYNIEDQTSNKTVGPWQSAAAWRSGRLIFHKASREELVVKLEERFEAKINLKGSVLKGVELNAVFENSESLREILQKLQLIYGVQYQLRDREIDMWT